MVDMNKRIAVLGIGYVGLPLAITLAKVGYKVTGIDVDKHRVKAINEGSLPVKEKDIEREFGDEKVRHNLSVSEKPCDADVFIVCHVHF